MSYEDNFSKQADRYARYRPQYPAALYEWIAAIAPGHDRVWDCGTGTQAYRDARGTDPIDVIRAELTVAWGGIGQHEVRWPLFMRVGRND
ncbi:MAG TPA: hypothetical protein VFF59_03725 [Anaerolineae bacterium]|nr:hypothetical protein [Anaerolineae bacterium]